MTPNFEAILEALARAEVRFVLVGGYSAMLHGSSLMTRDVDVVAPLNKENLTRLHRALGPYHPVHRMDTDRRPFTVDEAEKYDWNNLYLKTDLGVLDFLGSVKGLGDFEDCRKKSTILDFGSFEFRTLKIDALIEAKRAMGRPRDLQTADELEVIRGKQSSEE